LFATSFLASLAIEELVAASKNPVALDVAGTGATKTSSSATIMQATPANAPQDSRLRRAASSALSAPAW